MDQTLGAYSIIACQKAMDDAGVTLPCAVHIRLDNLIHIRE